MTILIYYDDKNMKTKTISPTSLSYTDTYDDMKFVLRVAKRHARVQRANG